MSGADFSDLTSESVWFLEKIRAYEELCGNALPADGNVDMYGDIPEDMTPRALADDEVPAPGGFNGRLDYLQRVSNPPSALAQMNEEQRRAVLDADFAPPDFGEELAAFRVRPPTPPPLRTR